MYLHNGATLVLQRYVQKKKPLPKDLVNQLTKVNTSRSSVQANTPGYSKYNLIMPRDSLETGPARLSPSYVSYLLIAEAVGSSKKSRLAPILTELENLGVYGIWEGGKGPARIVALNMEPWNGTSKYWDWNSTTPTTALGGVGDASEKAERPVVTLDLSKFQKKLVVKSKRLDVHPLIFGVLYD